MCLFFLLLFYCAIHFSSLSFLPPLSLSVLSMTTTVWVSMAFIVTSIQEVWWLQFFSPFKVFLTTQGNFTKSWDLPLLVLWIMLLDSDRKAESICYSKYYRHLNSMNSFKPWAWDVLPFICTHLSLHHQCWTVFSMKIIHIPHEIHSEYSSLVTLWYGHPWIYCSFPSMCHRLSVVGCFNSLLFTLWGPATQLPNYHTKT